jgi:hypothetical protein
VQRNQARKLSFVSKRGLSKRKKALLWAAVGTPGLLGFMANTPAKEATSNLASWVRLFGLPVPAFLNTAHIDEQVTHGVLSLYGFLATIAGLGFLKRVEPRQNAQPKN